MNAFVISVDNPLRANKTVDWARALQPAGRKRLAHLRKLAHLRHEMPVFADGSQEWVTDGESQGVVAFVRRLGDRVMFVAANLRNGEAEFKAGDVHAKRGVSPLLAEGGEFSDDGVCRLSPYGFIVKDCVP